MRTRGLGGVNDDKDTNVWSWPETATLELDWRRIRSTRISLSRKGAEAQAATDFGTVEICHLERGKGDGND